MSATGYSRARRRDERDVVNLVSRVVARVLDGLVDEVTAETPLTPEHGVDSLAFVEIVDLVESEAAALLGRPLTVDDRDFARLRTVGDVARYVAGRAEGG